MCHVKWINAGHIKPSIPCGVYKNVSYYFLESLVFFPWWYSLLCGGELESLVCR